MTDTRDNKANNCRVILREDLANKVLCPISGINATSLLSDKKSSTIIDLLTRYDCQVALVFDSEYSPIGSDVYVYKVSVHENVAATRETALIHEAPFLIDHNELIFIEEETKEEENV